ncbi:MAG: hypothetical protein WCI04_06960 [archaeon]
MNTTKTLSIFRIDIYKCEYDEVSKKYKQTDKIHTLKFCNYLISKEEVEKKRTRWYELYKVNSIISYSEKS